VTEPLRIGILGDFNPEFRSHHATNDALQHAARKLQLQIETTWIPTPSLLEAGAPANLDSFDGLWASAGSPFKSFDGMLKGIEFARVHDHPFIGTCAGFQYAIIEFARNVLGIHDATTAEEDPHAKNIVIYPVACAVPNRDPNAPKLSGLINEIHLRPGSFLATYYGREVIEEEFFCNYELNSEFEWMAMEAGFPAVARGSNGECRAIESPSHLFFIATLFQPQLLSREDNPHPLIVAFLQAAASFHGKRVDDSILDG
jgi:CTP synthase (UTP-ammonia lyase)